MTTTGHSATILATILLLALVAPPPARGGEAPIPAAGATTWCNPLSLPDYPIGKLARAASRGRAATGEMWLLGHEEQFRELADPTVLLHDGAWYLYPSVDMAWVSRDRGATWEHHPLNVRDIGYAPTVVRHQGRFLLLASGSELYAADGPLGPFTPQGAIAVPPQAHAPSQTDPMLFADDDGLLYYYWGCTPADGIWGVRLDERRPTTVLGTPRRLISFQPDTQPWQRCGDANQDRSKGWMEGAWMLKHDGRYYLTYSAAGTEHRTYAMGCAVATSPLGEFTAQSRNPILRSTSGLITGTGHGCIVPGPDGGWWAFYSLCAGHVHGFERRLGMDRAWFDAAGELGVGPATEVPQLLPGTSPLPPERSGAGWVQLNLGAPTLGSSVDGPLAGRFAVDDDLRTWWQPAADDAQPTLVSVLPRAATVRALRLAWHESGLDTAHGAHPGPFRYRLELETAPGAWSVLVDRSASSEDLVIDYRECPPASGLRVRLVILGAPAGITPGVAEFSVFGSVAAPGGP